MNVIIQLFVYDFANCKSEWERNRKQLRLRETSYCLFRNSNDASIESIHIFVDTQEALDYYSQYANEKVKFILHGKQPTYKDLVKYAIDTFSSGKLVCIMNSDIIFNSEKDHELIRKIAKPKRLISLTRHELTDDTHSICSGKTCEFSQWGGSSDTFIFTMPIEAGFQLNSIDHKQNMFGAENVFHKAWVDCGYEICNPCDDIITIHIHRDRVHFESYETINTENNSVANMKTKLTPELFT